MNICRLAAVWMMMAAPAFAAEQDIAVAIQAIKSTGKEGDKNDAAADAWQILTRECAPALIPTLSAMKDANVYAANWLRSAVDAIVEGEAANNRKLDAAALEKFLLDSQQSPAARRIAFELFEKRQPEKAKEVIASLIDDPSLDLRRDAIARRIVMARDDAKLLAPLFTAARDRDQVEALAKQLKKPAAEVEKHFNFISAWQIVGPFDGPKASGFATKYEPESGVNLKATYQGKADAKLEWKIATTKNLEEDGDKDYCLIDLNKELGKHKDSVAYAFAIVEVEKETPFELRAASQNGIKLFVNGQSVFEREAYHQGTMMDQHAGKSVLKAGKNEILIKICQNDQKQPWAQRWVFQSRICDSTGGAIPFKIITPIEAK